MPHHTAHTRFVKPLYGQCARFSRKTTTTTTTAAAATTTATTTTTTTTTTTLLSQVLPKA